MQPTGRHGARILNADTATGAVALALGLGALALVPAEVQGDGFAQFGNVRSPAFFPILAAGATTLFSLALVLRGLLRGAAPVGVRHAPRVAAVAAALAGATALIFWVGYILAAAALIAALSVAFGHRGRALTLGLAVVAPVAIYLLFDGVLDVLLPAGPF